jgi:hypothetical protein
LAFKHRCGSFVFSSIFEVACWLNEKWEGRLATVLLIIILIIYRIF